jgi:FdhE protein
MIDEDSEESEASKTEIDKITERIDEITSERPSHKEVLAFLKQVMTEQYKVKPGIAVDPVDIDKGLLEVKNKEGFPLVNRADLKMDIPSATSLFKGLCESLKQNEKISKDIERITRAVDSGELDFAELFDKAVREDRDYMRLVSDRLELQAGLLFFLAQNSLQPIFEAYADKLKGYVDQEKWWRSYCPICGSKPVIAELIGAERKKFLVCSCCGYEWRFKRTQCPFCDNEQAKSFKFFYTEQDGRAYRVETCQKCKKYIKTVDTEELEDEIIPAVEDMGTIHLDILAKKEGYTREVPPSGLNLEDL